MRARPLFTIALLGVGLPLAAQVTGGGTVSGGALQGGGPDVSHQEEASGDGVWFSGALSSLDGPTGFGLQWEGAGTPDFRVRGTLFSGPGWLLEVSVNQRAYFVGGDARFAWDPGTGVLDSRVPQTLRQYLPYPGSAAGLFDPATLPVARGLLPESSPGWAMRDFALTFRTLGRDRGVDVSVISNGREGVTPRTFVVPTGFAPALTPLTAGLPIGEPFGVVEVPERFSERSIGLSARAFTTAGAWRWEGQALAERYRLHRLITFWANPFPAPGVREPPYYRGTQAMVSLSGRSPNASVSAEYNTRWGHGEAGERRVGQTRLRAEYHRALGPGTWFVRGYAAHRDDAAWLEPAAPHPVFQGPYYDLLGARTAPAVLRVYPTSEAWAEGGVRSSRGEVSIRLRRFHSPYAFAKDRDSLSVLLAATPLPGLRLELRPGYTRASNPNPSADRLWGGWSQAKGFLPVTARNWRTLEASARYLRGPFMARALYALRDSGDAPGLQRRESGELFAGLTVPYGPWSVKATGRLSASDLSGTFTTYALPGDPLDPADPTHRLPLGEDWRRRGESVQVDVARAVEDVGTFGLVGRWDHQALRTDRVLDQPRQDQYGRAGFFWERGAGAFGIRAEAGVESYRVQDPLFVPAEPPPGPYLWTGLTERPGTRAYALLDVTLKF